jgi:glycerol kinase
MSKSDTLKSMVGLAIDKMKLGASGARDAIQDAVEQCKKLGFIGVAQATAGWIAEHPRETAAVVIPLVLLACTPAILSAMDFTATGIAAGTQLETCILWSKLKIY